MIKLQNINIKKYAIYIFLALILLFSYYIRAESIVPGKLLSFDPIFYYRYTRYFVDFGHLPAWDELSYFVGRLIEIDNAQPFLIFLTGTIFNIVKNFGYTNLFTVAAYMSAIYGALIVIPAFLLIRELSNDYGGLVGALMMGSAPQILIRTFGSSYDNDQLVMFFILLTMYAGIYAFRKRTVGSYCFALISFSSFMLMWGFSIYTFLILSIFAILYLFVGILIGEKKIGFSKKLKGTIDNAKTYFVFLIALFAGLWVFGQFVGSNIIFTLLRFLGFSQRAEQWIVNISIAELQPFSIFSPVGWITAMGRFIIGDGIIDTFILIVFAFFIFFSLFYGFKNKKVRELTFLLTLVLVGVYTTFRGIRFTEFTTGLFITVIASGLGYFIDWSKKDNYTKAFAIGLAFLISIVAMSLGAQIGQQLGPDINQNWDDAYAFFRTQTPELSLVGTWWDPGHMITGLAEKRVIGDGAHCQTASDGDNACLYTINDRIVDLGKTMATDNETVSLELIKKYMGTSPKAYWIASDDLIGKFQWVQFFGMGCDARVDARCPLYFQIPATGNQIIANSLNVRSYQDVVLVISGNVPIPILVQGSTGLIFDEVIFYSGENQVTTIAINETQKQNLTQSLKPFERDFRLRFGNDSVPFSLWISRDQSYVVVIPQNSVTDIRNNVFTKMFFMEGEGLQHFRQVFRNDQIKIYEVVF